jgi:hypothetical protein
MGVKKFISQYKLCPVNLENHSGISIYAVHKGREYNCSHNIGLIGLKPLTLAFSASDAWHNEVETVVIKKGTLSLCRLFVKPAALKNISGFTCYYITDSHNYVRSFFNRQLDFLFIGLKNLLQEKQKFFMETRQLVRLFDFCLYPRPVYMVCAPSGEKPSCFPIDVIGFYALNTALLSVRKSNGAIHAILKNGELALCSIPFAARKKIYALGKNVTPDKLKEQEYETVYSSYKNFLYPSYATSLSLLKIQHAAEIGEHLCLVCVVQETLPFEPAGQLAHLPWYMINSPI